MNLCKNCGIDGLGDVVGSPVDWSNPDYTTPTEATYSSPSVYTTPASSGSGFNWNSVGSIANAFSSIFKSVAGPLPAGCIQVAGPYGMSTQCGGSNQPSLSMSSLSSSLGSNSSLLLIGGAVLVVMLMITHICLELLKVKN